MSSDSSCSVPEPRKSSVSLRRFKRLFLRALSGFGIAAAPAVVFLIVNSGRTLNPFAVLLACRALISVGLVIGVSYFIFDTMVCRLLKWSRGGGPAVWRFAVVVLFAAFALYIGAFARIG